MAVAWESWRNSRQMTSIYGFSGKRLYPLTSLSVPFRYHCHSFNTLGVIERESSESAATTPCFPTGPQKAKKKNVRSRQGKIERWVIKKRLATSIVLQSQQQTSGSPSTSAACRHLWSLLPSSVSQGLPLFVPTLSGSLYVWNRISPRISRALRNQRDSPLDEGRLFHAQQPVDLKPYFRKYGVWLLAASLVSDCTWSQFYCCKFLLFFFPSFFKLTLSLPFFCYLCPLVC